MSQHSSVSRFTLSAVFGLGLVSLVVGGSACSVPFCEANPGDPTCVMPNPTAQLEILTLRLNRNGGIIKVTAKGAVAADRIVLTLDNKVEVVAALKDAATGAAEASFTAAQLAGLTTGPVTATLKFGTKTPVSKNIRIYQPPSFMDGATTKATYTTGTRMPGWVQVSKNHIFSGNESATNRAVVEYSLNGTMIAPTAVREPLLIPLPLTSVIDINENLIVRATQNGAMAALENSDIGAVVDMYASFRTLNLTKVNALSTDRKNNFVAVAGEGQDAGLKVYIAPAAGATQVSPVTVSGGPTMAIMRLGVGILDADNALDVVAQYADGSAGVFLQDMTSKALTFNAGLSTALTGQLGAAVKAVAVGDIDKDGQDDIVIIKGDAVSYASIDGTTVTSGMIFPTGVMGDAVAVGDVSGDGKPDLIVAQKSTNQLIVFINQAQ